VRRDISFISEGVELAGWFYPPANASTRYPAVVLAHGYSAVKEQYLDRYAEIFSAAGIAALVFDHANFGGSGGSPRFEVDPERQKRGYRDAITFLQTLEGPDPERIGIWGTSFSGGHVLVVAALDRRVKAAVSQVPTISGSQAARRRMSPEKAASLQTRFDVDRRRRLVGELPGMVPVVSNDPSALCALPGQDSFHFFTQSISFAPSWNPEVTLRSIELARENEPGTLVTRISPTPLLMIVADDDRLTPADLIIGAFDKVGEPKRLHVLRGGHFSPYLEHFETTSTLARDWFLQHL
jgi:fermentation-respiration switch protein FrsA (DUF1100 family)